MQPAASDSAFRLGDLLDQHELGLEVRLGDADARSRTVSGVHAIEVERPGRWLAPDWVMLTTGVRLAGDEAAQRALPGELVDAGIAALGFGEGLTFRTVPPALVEAADAVGLPLFAVPLRTPFREVVAVVHRALLSSDLRALQRLSSMQRYLIDALQLDEPGPGVVHRAATLLDASVGVVGPGGGVEQHSGELPPSLGSLVAPGADDHAPRELDVDGWRVVVVPVVADGASDTGRRLVAAAPDPRFVNRLTRPVLQAAAPLLAAVGRVEEAGRRQEHALRRALLDELLGLPPGAETTELEARAHAFGLDLGAPHLVIAGGATATAAASTPEGPDAATRIGRLLDEAGVPHLVTRQRDRAVVLMPVVDEETGRALRAGGITDPGVAWGSGRVFRGARGVAESAADAHVVADLVPPGATRRWRRYADLDLTELAASQIGTERVGTKVDELLAALDERPGAREALEAWFAADLDVTAAARTLHLHPNSLRYRLGRLAESLDRPLRSPATIGALHLALAIERRRGA